MFNLGLVWQVKGRLDVIPLPEILDHEVDFPRDLGLPSIDVFVGGDSPYVDLVSPRDQLVVNRVLHEMRFLIHSLETGGRASEAEVVEIMSPIGSIDPRRNPSSAASTTSIRS